MTLTHAVMACIISFSAGGSIVALWAAKMIRQTNDRWAAMVAKHYKLAAAYADYLPQPVEDSIRRVNECFGDLDKIDTTN